MDREAKAYIQKTTFPLIERETMTAGDHTLAGLLTTLLFSLILRKVYANGISGSFLAINLTMIFLIVTLLLLFSASACPNRGLREKRVMELIRYGLID